jgi:acyl-CoA thioesterase
VRLELPVDEVHTNLYGIAHGGVLMTMADTAMGAACLACNKKVVTISLTTDFMHAVPLTETVVTTAKVLHDGRHTMTCECELQSKQGKIFAKAHANFYVLGQFVE